MDRRDRSRRLQRPRLLSLYRPRTLHPGAFLSPRHGHTAAEPRMREERARARADDNRSDDSNNRSLCFHKSVFVLLTNRGLVSMPLS